MSNEQNKGNHKAHDGARVNHWGRASLFILLSNILNVRWLGIINIIVSFFAFENLRVVLFSAWALAVSREWIEGGVSGATDEIHGDDMTLTRKNIRGWVLTMNLNGNADINADLTTAKFK